MTNRARSSSPRSVSMTHRDVAFVEARLGDAGVEQRSAVQVEGPTEGLAVREDLRLEHVLHGRDRADLFEERQVDVGLHVARGTRIAVPVPGAPEVAAALEDEEVVDALLRQARRGEHPGEPATDDHDIGLDAASGLAPRPGCTGLRRSAPARPSSSGTAPGLPAAWPAACRAPRRTSS